MSFNKINENFYQFGSMPVIVEFLDNIMFSNESKTIGITIGDKSANVMSWGDKNDLCDIREELIGENNIIPQLLKTMRNINLGSGIFYYNEIQEDGLRKVIEVDPGDEIRNVIEGLEEDDFFEELTNDFVKNSLAYVRFKNDGNNKYSIATIKSRYIRPAEMNDEGKIDTFFRCGDWKKKENIVAIASYQAVKQSGKPALQFIHKIGDNFLGNEYFPIPVWWTGYKWIEIGNKIPEFHSFNLENQYFTPLHIEIPKGYFYQANLVKMGKFTEAEAREAEAEARQKFLQTVDTVLAGTKNAGKAVWTEYSLSEMKKEYGGIKFNELKIPRGDDALLKLFEKTNEANISGTGVHPSLAAIMTGDSLSSGSEIRNALDMYIITQALLSRKQLLKPLNILKRLNGWDSKLKFGFRDVQLTTTDKNPTGQQAVTAN